VRRLNLALLLVGLLTLIGLVWHIGPRRILEAAAGLGPLALLIILLPSVLMYALETFGWRLTLGRNAAAVTFWRLCAVRTAGEVVNMTTPAAYVGGEPLKAYLLQRSGVRLVEGLASVVTAKTTMTIAQIAFMVLGIGLAFRTLGASGTSGGSSNGTVLAAGVGVGFLLAFTAAFLLVQHRGLFTGLLSLLRRLKIRIAYLEHREQRLQDLDRTIVNFYTLDRRGFLLSIGFCFLGWLAEALEVYVMLSCLGGPADPLTAISIGALSVFIKGGTFFIPGSVGAQEAGNLLLLMAFGYSDVTGLTFALLRRLRELVWIGIGLGCLAALGGRGDTAQVGEISQ
jgi:uncharacterized protein (TIRG00374 family)